MAAHRRRSAKDEKFFVNQRHSHARPAFQPNSRPPGGFRPSKQDRVVLKCTRLGRKYEIRSGDLAHRSTRIRTHRLIPDPGVRTNNGSEPISARSGPDPLPTLHLPTLHLPTLPLPTPRLAHRSERLRAARERTNFPEWSHE